MKLKSNFSFSKILYIGLFYPFLLLFNCAPSINYLGRQYNPTTHVDIFFDTNDIKKSYEVIGKVDGFSGVLGSSYGDIQKKVIETAQKKGADGVIFYNMEQRVIGTSYSSTTDHRQWLKSNTDVYSSNRTEDVLHADFIKYQSKN
ncbi:hypothetical protein HZQ75_02050 [Elizabethkingia anophelis]|uniref:Uncharacterized protein n=1 Tax=Elizabethkingia anophelis R26 TaxID=1246994 RepID=A0ABN5BPP2_9FLAO|nr:hypothetical protein [Elizabethkingia anophelis]ATC35808.1 hypothetical protein BAZ09_006075 [Elizabethkingia anophelis R26]ATC39446.1 hypothetical protein EAAG1_006075 [Elizabethkingia anophelis Ag1]ATC43125.1 hypothetical protein CMV41_06075 [Elizabethkingia anophelis]ATC46801.1 hypothetical protein CMV40_06075 [Elizabethkingia anophelis]ELR81169.1 hypothetical protein D505_00715 [Elizabethkingia anophelis R26]